MKTTIASLIAATTLAAAPVSAQVVYEPIDGLISVEFLDGWRMENGRHMAAARIRLDNGWKTYWRATGGIGIPAQFDWNGSENIAEVRFHWPTPRVWDQDGLITIGYKTELVLPIEFTARDAGLPIKIRSGLEFGVCADVCLPVTAQIDAVLPPAGESGRPAIAAALRDQPASAEKAGYSNLTCALTPKKNGFDLTARFDTPRPLSHHAVTVVEYPNESFWIETARTEVSGSSVTAQTTVVSLTKSPVFLDRGKIRVTVLDQGGAVDMTGCPAG